MKYYLAPLEGITSYVYRNAYHRYFCPMDKYFTPFIVPHKEKKFSTREKKELSPEHNQGLFVVPQLLTNCAEDFLKTAEDIRAMGYEEINLNLGCPSGTVVAKKKGAGFLAFPEELLRFLDRIYEKCDMKISVKTRLGKESPEEFEQILDIYRQFPIHELIIHPRVQTDMYRNTPNLEVFGRALLQSKIPVCYNGDIVDRVSYESVVTRFPQLHTVMCGRGVIANPGLVEELKEGRKLAKDRLRMFHDEIYEEYRLISSGDKNVLFKMKELWFYMICLFDSAGKYEKKIKKSERLSDYEAVIDRLFAECPLQSDL